MQIEPQTDAPLTDEDIAAQEREQLQELYGVVAKRRDEWVAHRAQSGIESEWKRAEALYEGQDAAQEDDTNPLATTLKNGPSGRKKATQQRSRVVVNIVGPAVETATSRVCEILLPVDDKNWGLRPTPNPRLSAQAKDDRPIVDASGQQVDTVSAVAGRVQQRAKESCSAMEREIDDQLTESNYNGECRKVIASSTKLGTGVIKGPFVVRREKRSWQMMDGRHQKQVVEDYRPSSVYVSCWNVFPDPACGDDIQRGEGLYEKKDLTRKELRQLAKRPGYDPDAVRRVLMQRPQRLQTVDGRINKSEATEDLYEVWEYHGDLDSESMSFLQPRLNGYQDTDPLEVRSGCLILVNDIVIGLLPMLTADNSLPYDFFQWKKREGSPWGSGVAKAKEIQQRVINASWRQVMDNAGLTTGAQFVINKDMIVPEDGTYTIYNNKVWLAKSDVADVRQAFTVIQIDSRIAELLKITEAAMAFADQESGVSPMMQGEQAQAAETLGGMTMRWTNANGVMRLRVKLFDDQITRPHLARYYDWNMESSEKEEIKGDFEVDARGSSTLIERDIANQAMTNIAQLSSVPSYAPYFKPSGSLRAILKSWKVNPDDHMKTEEECDAIDEAIKAQAEQGPSADPKIEAQMAMKQMDMDNAAAEREAKMALAQQQDAASERSIQYNSQREQGEYSIAMTKEQNARDLELLKLSTAERTTAQQLQAQRGIKELEIDSKHQLFNAEAQIKAQQGSGI